MQIKKDLNVVILCFIFCSICLGQPIQSWHKKKISCVKESQPFVPLSAYFFDDKRGLLVGETGEIKSKATYVLIQNGLDNCVSTISSTSSAFDDVFFVTNEHGWIVGSKVSSDNSIEEVLLETFDGGKNWNEKEFDFLFHKKYKEIDFDSIYFTKNDEGFILGKIKDQENNLKGIIFKTEDNGESWKEIYTSESEMFFEDIGFDTSGKFGWVITNKGIIFNTEDGGVKWRQQNTKNKVSLTKVKVINSREVWVTSESSNLFYTKDGGKNWKTVSIKVNDQKLKKKYSIWFSGIFFNNTGNGWICGSGGLIMRTKDFGKTWKIESSGEADFLYKIVPSGNKLIAIGNPNTILEKNLEGKY